MDYCDATAFLRGIDRDWAHAIDLIGPCTHDPKAAREPYEALVRAIGYQQLTARAGDATIARLKALLPGPHFPTPEQIIGADPTGLRACEFSATKVNTIKSIAEAALSGLVPCPASAADMADAELIDRIVASRASAVGRWR